MSRGRRYNNEPKLNIKKVVAVIVAIIVIVMFVIALKKLITSDSSSSKLVSTTYFLISKDSKWGVIDNTSKIVIEPTYEEAIIIPNNKKDIFICTYDENYEDGTYKTKVLNSKNKEIFSQYDAVNALENYDENKNLWYEEDVLCVKKDGKYGLINFAGENILSIEYDKIYTLKGVENSIITEKNEKVGLVNCSGKIIIENNYDEIKSLGKNSKCYIVKEDNKYGVYGILDCKYQEIQPLDNKEYFCVKENDKNKVINENGEEIFKEAFDSIDSIKDNIIVYKYKNEYNAYNLKANSETDNIKLEQSYKELKYIANNLMIVKINNNYGIININNDIKVEAKYKNINYYDDVEIYELEENEEKTNIILDKNLNEISKGILNETNSKKGYIKVWTENGYKYYKPNGEEKKSTEVLTKNNLFLNKQNGKYGFIDKNGNVVVDYIYDDAKEQNDFGYICVKKDGLWGCLDKQGKEVCETKYTLEDNLLIDFIGEYHLGEDLNLMYYTNR